MNCPVCGKEMEQGYLDITGEVGYVAWGRKSDAPIPAIVHEITLRNGFKDMFKYSNFPAYICKECKKIVVDYEFV